MPSSNPFPASRRRHGLPLAALLLLAAAPRRAQTAAISNTTLALKTRDGVALHTLLFLPSPLPPAARLGCVLVRTPYGIVDAGSAGALAAAYAQAGWCAIAQDERGRYGSGGAYSLFRTEANDTADLIAWATAQPWSNGMFAQTGTSANAISGYVVPLADPVPPAGMRAQYNIVGDSTLHESLFQGGAYKDGDYNGWLTACAETPTIPVVERSEAWSSFWLPVGAESSDGDGNDAPRWGLTDYPIVHAAGFYDIFSSWQIAQFDALQANGGPRNAGQNFLVVEAGGHCAGGAIAWPNSSWGWSVAQGFSTDLFAASIGLPIATPDVGEAKVALLRAMRREQRRARLDARGAAVAGALEGAGEDPAAEAEAVAVALRAAAGHSPFHSGANIIWYVLGPGIPGSVGNMWAAAPSWPATTSTPLFLLHGGLLSLSPPPSGAPPPATPWTSDPAHPIPTLGGNNLIVSPCGPQDQRPLEAAFAGAMALFTSAAFTNAAVINGAIKVQLWVTSSAVDTDITAKLSDVFPTGESMLVQDGILRLRWREGPLARRPAAPLQPGVPVEVTVDVGFMSYVVNAGHCLRLALASSNAPRFSVNRQNGRPLFDNTTAAVVAENAVLTDADHPSALVLPILDAARLAELRV